MLMIVISQNLMAIIFRCLPGAAATAHTAPTAHRQRRTAASSPNAAAGGPEGAPRTATSWMSDGLVDSSRGCTVLVSKNRQKLGDMVVEVIMVIN